MSKYSGISYVTSDKKSFKSLEDAMKHEDKLVEEAEKKKIDEEERNRRASEVNEAYSKYLKLRDDYYVDYPLANSRDDLYRRFFSF